MEKKTNKQNKEFTLKNHQINGYGNRFIAYAYRTLVIIHVFSGSIQNSVCACVVYVCMYDTLMAK